jgi:uncharacterized protein YqjF (DUF2071 family)
MPDILSTIHHRPYALPGGRWRMAQRWNDLLFAHWPIPSDAMARLIPPSLEVDTFDGFAWAGVVPFWMDRVRSRAVGAAALTVPGTASFAELNLRTYVRSRITGQQGVYFFSLDAASLLAVIGARTLFHLPYYWAKMQRETRADGSIAYESTRLLSRQSVRFSADYKGLGTITPSLPGTLEHFLTERYCLFTAHGNRLSVGHIHHLPWPLEAAEAEIRRNELPAAHGVILPDRPPVLHFARELEVYIWSLHEDGRGFKVPQ